MAEDWIPVREASKISDYHPEHIRKLIREGKIKGRKFVILWLVELRSLNAYMKNQAIKYGEIRGRPKKQTS